MMTENRVAHGSVYVATNSDAQTFLELFGTGIRGRSSLANVTATIGGEQVDVLFVAIHGEDDIDLAVGMQVLAKWIDQFGSPSKACAAQQTKLGGVSHYSPGTDVTTPGGSLRNQGLQIASTSLDRIPDAKSLQ